jgi:mono/diheme cytochrome c family protein
MKAVWIGLAVLALSGGVTLGAAEPAPATFVKNMKDLSAATRHLRTALAGGDFVSVDKASTELAALLKVNTAFWEKRKVADAVEQAEAASKAVGALAVAAKAKDAAGAKAAQKVLSSACSACHTKHRERTPDGKYVIK